MQPNQPTSGRVDLLLKYNLLRSSCVSSVKEKRVKIYIERLKRDEFYIQCYMALLGCALWIADMGNRSELQYSEEMRERESSPVLKSREESTWCILSVSEMGRLCCCEG